MGGPVRETINNPRAGAARMRWALAICATILVSGCAQAQSDEPGALPRLFKLRTVPPPAPDFVVKSRPPEGSLQFIPTGAARPAPSGKPLTPDEIRAKERELDSTRAKQDQIVGRPSTPPAARSVADGGMQKKKPAPPLRCVLTCPDPATAPVKPGVPQQPVSGL